MHKLKATKVAIKGWKQSEPNFTVLCNYRRQANDQIYNLFSKNTADIEF